MSWVKYDASQYGFYLLVGYQQEGKLPVVRKDPGGATSS